MVFNERKKQISLFIRKSAKRMDSVDYEVHVSVRELRVRLDAKDS